jgi:guanidinobutyrase
MPERGKHMLNQPQSGNDMPRFAGIPTMMRLPVAEDARGLDAAFVGIPLDIGTSNRSGTRYGPRQIRQESVMIRPYNMGTGAAPFERLQVADLGDVAINPYSLADSVRRIELAYSDILAHGCIPLTLGGDHTLTLPILRAAAGRHGPVGLIHVDAHSDTNEEMFGEQLAHGTTFRRAFEEGLLAPQRVVQIGLRGSGYEAADFDWSRRQGFRVVQAERVLVSLFSAADGRSARADGQCAGLSELRYRWAGSGICSGYRHAGSWRAVGVAGPGNCPRMPGA